MTREQLAEAGQLSIGPIKRIETEGHVPKANTLQQIAEGLATYAPGRRDDELARSYYEQLMRAAGYAGIEQADAMPLQLSPEAVLAELAQDPEIAALLAEAARKYPNMSPRQRNFLVHALTSLQVN